MSKKNNAPRVINNSKNRLSTKMFIFELIKYKIVLNLVS